MWGVGARTYRLRTVGVGTDERGEFAWLEPYEEPLDSGLWLRVEAEREELFGEEHVYCRVSVLRVSDVFVDPNSALRQQGIDPASVNVLMWPPPVVADLSILFLEGGTPTEWTGPIRRVLDQAKPTTH